MTKQQATITALPDRKPGESDNAYARRLAAFIRGEDVRSKGDNREFTGSLPFHLSRDHESDV